MIKEYNSSIKS